jgi:acetyl-CoA C-acetyltransferase
MPEAVIVDTVRTPIGRAFKGSLAQLRPDEMGAFVVDQLLERNQEVDPKTVEDVFCGCGSRRSTSPGSLCCSRRSCPSRSTG